MGNEKEKEKRRKLNEDILRRLKAGELLQDPAKNTWFPPRPIIPKDAKSVKKLYGEEAKVLNTKKYLESIKDKDDDGKE